MNYYHKIINEKNLRTRFAPSPTGFLHLGHLLSAMYVWGIARLCNAQIILRIEDHDQSRCKKEFEEAILRDLAWLGFVPDDGVSNVSKPSKFRQSDCLAIYEKHMRDFHQQGLLYGCECSRQDIVRRTGKKSIGLGNNAEDEQAYDGACEAKNISLANVPRVRIKTSNQDFIFEDLHFGVQKQNPKRQCGDFLLRDHLKQYTYQHAVSIDDFYQQINLIIRGEDILPSAGRQLYLASLLNRTDPIFFCHHPLIRDASGKKLSKRFFSEAVSKLRADNYSPKQLLKFAAEKAGLGEFPNGLEVKDLKDVFGKVYGAT